MTSTSNLDIQALKRWLQVATQPYHPRYKAAKAHGQAMVVSLAPALIARLEAAEAKADEQEAQIEALELDGEEYEKDCKKALVSMASAFNYEWDGDGATADDLREFIQETVREAQARAAAMQWRPIEEAHEDWGVCVFINIHEPEPICASTMDDDFAETAKHYGWTHFLRITLTNEDAAALLAALPAPPEATR